MTAEIAILNKSAVALATDSAVTITAADKEQKIFFSADKLFELSRRNPLGIMIYNGMQFMQAPMHMLVHDFRSKCSEFNNVESAAEAFLEYLNEWGASAPDEIKMASVRAIVSQTLELINGQLVEAVQNLLKENKAQIDVAGKMQEATDLVVKSTASVYSQFEFADFTGGRPRINQARREQVRALVAKQSLASETYHDQIVDICFDALLRQPLSNSLTGVVIAGYGSDDIFPTMVSYEIDGMVFGKLKHLKTNYVDIDRRKDRARVMPFAQKEMVERFLYGIDGDIESSIHQWCAQTVPNIKDEIIQSLKMSKKGRQTLATQAKKAEEAFLTELRNAAFQSIRTSSRNAIDAMVEFMPKPELATMAEALVNLTSIKRRVSRGMETVGGPIDVALISKSEGFVWVKRKHYFSAELNPRYGLRVTQEGKISQGDQNGTPSEIGENGQA